MGSQNNNLAVAGQYPANHEAAAPDAVAQLVRGLKRKYAGRITGELVLPASAADYRPLPTDLHPGLAAALKQKGTHRLYSHQTEALGASHPRRKDEWMPGYTLIRSRGRVVSVSEPSFVTTMSSSMRTPPTSGT